MVQDKNGRNIGVGDIVLIEGSPIKTFNGTFLVAHSGPTKYWCGHDDELCLYRVGKVGDKFAVSSGKATTQFYPLYSTANRRTYSREDLARLATIEVIKPAAPETLDIEIRFEVIPPSPAEYAYVAITADKPDFYGRYSDHAHAHFAMEDERELLKAFLSNLTVKKGQRLSVSLNSDEWRGTYYGREGIKCKITEVQS
jgi:hypothetical protein